MTRPKRDFEATADLRDAIDAGRRVEIAHAIEQRQFDAGHLCEAGIALHLTDQLGLVELRKCLRPLIQELQTVTTLVYVAQLPRDDDLEDHAGLMRRAVECRGAQQRKAVVDTLMLHQWVNPLHGVWRAGNLVFRAQNEIEAMSGVRQALLLDCPGERRG